MRRRVNEDSHVRRPGCPAKPAPGLKCSQPMASRADDDIGWKPTAIGHETRSAGWDAGPERFALGTDLVRRLKAASLHSKADLRRLNPRRRIIALMVEDHERDEWGSGAGAVFCLIVVEFHSMASRGVPSAMIIGLGPVASF